MLPLDRVRSGEFAWSAMRGPFFAGFERSLAVYAEAGNNLVVEHIIEDEAWMQRVVRLLHRLDVFFVGVRCDLDELEQRERQRGDRLLGDARRDFFTVHRHAVYDRAGGLRSSALNLSRPVSRAGRLKGELLSKTGHVGETSIAGIIVPGRVRGGKRAEKSPRVSSPMFLSATTAASKRLAASNQG